MRTRLLTFTLTLAALGAALPLHAASVPASITVQTDQAGPRVDPRLYGIFFEEINCAGDGGLYAELVRNRSFEDSDRPEHWQFITSGGAKGSMTVTTEHPRSEMNRRALRLQIEAGSQGCAGIANDGWWGMSLVKGAKYVARFACRTEQGFAGPLTVSLEHTNGTVYAQKAVRLNPRGGNDGWQEYEVTLTSDATDPSGRLVISASQPGTVWLDMVSLFPRATWKGRENGLRPDLAAALTALKPAFVRFPGGCWVEGDTMEHAYRWKQTIGPVSERRTQYNIWRYTSTHGLGYHEYLQLCEDLKAEPMFVINCGMSHKENVPLDQMGPFVQDALDAIEYANGPVGSKWGALRAKAGHPKPFNLRLLEIGNENGGKAYDERYAMMYRAIKEKYPQMELIANHWAGGVPSSAPVEIVDEHYYSTPNFFVQNATRYDSYDRKGAKVYVGEYAVTRGCGQGNLAGALGEAAFMLGMERNSDVVIMSSYAPLFSHVSNKRWNPDLIYFDSSRIYLPPSYHVQKLFADYRPDVNLKTTVAVDISRQEPARGGIGLGTWNTQAEYKDIRVTAGGKVLLEAKSPADLQGWTPHGGDWKAAEGVIRQSAGGDDRRLTTGDKSWGDYTLELKARKLGGAEGFLVMFHAADEDNYLWWNLGGWGNARHGIERSLGGAKSEVGRDQRGSIELNRWYDIRIELTGNRIRCHLDGKLIHDAADAVEYKPLHAAAGRVDRTGEIILKVVNVADTACETKLRFDGVRRLRPAAPAIILTSGSAADENSFATPRKVYPREEAIPNLSSDASYTFAPNSLTIFRLKP